MSTTNTKKEIVDYLWDWAEQNGTWAKHLVKEVVEKERPLDKNERDNIYQIFSNEIGLTKGMNASPVVRPTFNPAVNDVRLTTLSDVQGVNRLADKQKLDFSTNVTVIYGENGTGKTGYGRILKLLGLSYEKGTRVLPNVYAAPPQKQSFTIQYTVNNTPKTFTWDGKNHTAADELQGVSIFNNNCVRLSLDKNRELLVTPVGFHLFSILSNELKELDILHSASYTSYPTAITWKEMLHDGTAVHKFITELSDRSTLADLKRLSQFSEDDEQELVRSENNLKGLNKELITAELKTYNLQILELDSVINILGGASEALTQEAWEEYQKACVELHELTQQKKKGLQDVTKNRGIELYDSEQFQAFLVAADQYITSLQKETYPTKDDVCVYCRQNLNSQDAIELLHTYRQLLNDTTEDDIKRIKQAAHAFATSIAALNSDLILHQPSFGIAEDESAVQPEILKVYNRSIKGFQLVVSEKDLDKIRALVYEMDFETLITELKNKKTSISEVVNGRKATLDSLSESEQALLKKIHELKDKKLLSEKKSDVETAIGNLKVVALLDKKRSSFNTTSISRRTTDARQSLISDKFSDIFQEELRSIRRSHIKVNLDFRTDRGVSKLVQQIQSQYEISEILSEGEQKAIALAEFLTELKLDNSKSPVIFDDPITSLDHYIIDEVARRLVKLSEERQVIIFTHSVLLFNSIKQKSELHGFKKLQFKYYETEKDLEFTGYLYDSPDLKQDNFTNYEKRINALLNLPKEERNRRENDLAIEGYNKLRAAIEVMVEKEVLHDTVKRYRKNVALTALEKIKGGLIEKHKEGLNAVFERCCGYIDAHSNPDPLAQEPNLEGLKLDLGEVQKIRAEFLS